MAAPTGFTHLSCLLPSDPFLLAVNDAPDVGLKSEADELRVNPSVRCDQAPSHTSGDTRPDRTPLIYDPGHIWLTRPGNRVEVAKQLLERRLGCDHPARREDSVDLAPIVTLKDDGTVRVGAGFVERRMCSINRIRGIGHHST